MDLENLFSWFIHNKRSLPWRLDIQNPYYTLVSEFMLQQTQVKTVIEYFKRWMDNFPTLKSLAEGSEEKVLSLWSGLGYYHRARNLYRSAQMICKQGYPQDIQSALSLPGVGKYTAGALLSIGLNIECALVDGNVLRVFSRLRRIPYPNANHPMYWELASLWIRFFSQRRNYSYRVINESLMELGATICLPKNPQCLQCPIQKSCWSFKMGQVDRYPPPKIRKKTIQLKEQSWVIQHQGQILIQKRDSSWANGYYDVMRDEQISFRDKKLGHKVGNITYTITHHRIIREVFVLSYTNNLLLEGIWVSIDQIKEYPISSAMKKTIQLFKMDQKNFSK